MVDSSFTKIQNKVRRLTASPSQNQLSDDDLNDYIDRFYESDLPAALKLWELKSTYEFFTTANEDRYELPVNTFQGVRNPVYVDGLQVPLYLDQGPFWSQFPRLPDKQTLGQGDGSAGAYSFTISDAPLTKRNVMISALDSSGNTVTLEDDGAGGWYEAGTTTAATGTINYLTGAITVTFQSGGVGTTIPTTSDIVSTTTPYVGSKPTTMLYFNKYIYLRPIPDEAYRISVQVYRRPVTLFEDSSGNHPGGTEPDIHQWFDLIAIGAARKILEDRGDWETRANLEGTFREQMDLALNRTVTQNTQKRSATIYSENNGRYGSWPGAQYWSGFGL